MFVQVLLLFVGVFLLLKGGDWLVNGSSNLARRYNISELAIGLTVVAFGTSSPELVVNTIASVNHHSDIAFGNVIGSNNFNLFIILGISGLIAPLAVQNNTVWKEIPLSLVAAGVLWFLSNDPISDKSLQLSRIDGVLLLLFFIGFLYYVYRSMKTADVLKENSTPLMHLRIAIFLIITGLASLFLGGRIFVNAAIELARTLEISEQVISLTIVAAGTSLPELVTSLVAVVKKNSDLAVGNIIGSNIFNIFLILGVSSVIRPIPYHIVFNTDLAILIIGTIALFVAMFTGRKKKLDRWEAMIMVAFFIGYMVWTFYR